MSKYTDLFSSAIGGASRGSGVIAEEVEISRVTLYKARKSPTAISMHVCEKVAVACGLGKRDTQALLAAMLRGKLEKIPGRLGAAVRVFIRSVDKMPPKAAASVWRGAVQRHMEEEA